MSTFQKILQEVVEEHTLYLIKANRENQALHKENAELKNRLHRLERAFENISGIPLPKIKTKKWYQVWK